MDDYEAEIDAAEARRAAMAEARAEAYEILERTAHITAERRSYFAEPDAMEEWRRNMPKPEVSYDRKPDIQRRKLTDAESLRWRNYIDGRIDAGIAAALAEIRSLSDVRQEAVGKALGAIRAQLRAEVQEQIGSLRADLTIIEKAAAGDHARVIDLPAILPRDRRAG